ncbi:PASTA domain-containing protein [Streptomyces sp. NPDC097619]|uniref:PASTA domain-containing protein n=1 Tax=Streptomyces sp. NPDC097619 TaxID=3157228 RepID=UPI0033173CB0
MRTHLTDLTDLTHFTRPTHLARALAGAALLLTLTACEAGGASDAEAPSGDRPPGRTASAPASDEPTAVDTAALPDMTGKGLQSAQDRAQAAGFHDLHSHDALGRGRVQALDRNWKVCGQVPAPGPHPVDARVDFASVKLDETCPGRDHGATPGGTATSMPDFTGKSVKVARQALDPSTNLTVNDASSADRMVLVESNWQVCEQDPAPGTELAGRPVTLRAVKYDESC